MTWPGWVYITFSFAPNIHWKSLSDNMMAMHFNCIEKEREKAGGVEGQGGGCVGWARIYLKFYLNMDDQFVELIYAGVTACWKITSAAAAVVVGTSDCFKIRIHKLLICNSVCIGNWTLRVYEYLALARSHICTKCFTVHIKNCRNVCGACACVCLHIGIPHHFIYAVPLSMSKRRHSIRLKC